MWSIGLDTGVAITVNTEEGILPNQSYFLLSSDQQFIRMELHLSPQDFLYQISLYTKLFLTYTDPIWTKFEDNPLKFKVKPISGVRYYLPCEMQKSINDILQMDKNHVLSEMRYTSLSLETLVNAFLSIDKIQFNCISCSMLEIENSETEFLEKALGIITNRFQEKLTIPEIAKEVGTNQCYLKKKFKMHYGETIFGTITRIRMNKAHEMIRSDSNQKLTEIAESVGYSSSSSFSTAFKQFFGFSPQELRR